MTINSFVKSLSAYAGESVFNPYSDKCSFYDRHDAPSIRRSNIRNMMNAALEGGASTLWVARDLGYRGGRRTGLALTDEYHLGHLKKMIGSDGFRRATKGPIVKERTASVIWETLLRIDEPVMLWNVFPFHPHDPEDHMTNRCHTKQERLDCVPFLESLIELLNPKKIVAIGRDAAHALENLSIPVHQARHPSYGGQTTFIRQIEELYGLLPKAKPARSRQLLLSPKAT